MNIAGHDIGVCSWSLQPKDLADLVAMVRPLGLRHVQLALGNLVQMDDKRKHQQLGHLRDADLVLTAGMIGFPGEDYSSIAAIRRTGGFVPDDQWPLRRRLAKEAARLGRELGTNAVSTHVGFVPPPGEPHYDVMVSRLGEVAGDFAAVGVDLLMETGQERADELAEFMREVGAPNVFVNFDPANMILYGAGDPIEAIRTLGKHIRHVHVKDGMPSQQPGEQWGEEVPFGAGRVGPAAFLKALKSVGYTGPLVIEREAGANRVGDVRAAIEALRRAAP